MKSYQVYACKATIKDDCLLAELDIEKAAEEVANNYFEIISKLLKSKHCKPCVCVKIKKDGVTIYQYGSI